MQRSILVWGAISLFLFSSCSGKKVKNLENQLLIRSQQVEQLDQQLTHLQTTNAGLLDQMEVLSVVTKADAESIQQSLKSINQQYGFIQDLTEKIQYKDSLNLALVMNLKRSLADFDDEDVFVEVRGGLVYISISDRMLFRSGSARISTSAEVVLEKLARVINDHDELNVLVEGHTDNVPINTDCMVDNWDLSVKRATSVVRAFQYQYSVSPDRLTASGKSEYTPKASNQSSEGRMLNRRTEIVLTPELDQFFELLAGDQLIN